MRVLWIHFTSIRKRSSHDPDKVVNCHREGVVQTKTNAYTKESYTSRTGKDNTCNRVELQMSTAQDAPKQTNKTGVAMKYYFF